MSRTDHSFIFQRKEFLPIALQTGLKGNHRPAHRLREERISHDCNRPIEAPDYIAGSRRAVSPRQPRGHPQGADGECLSGLKSPCSPDAFPSIRKHLDLWVSLEDFLPITNVIRMGMGIDCERQG